MDPDRIDIELIRAGSVVAAFAVCNNAPSAGRTGWGRNRRDGLWLGRADGGLRQVPYPQRPAAGPTPGRHRREPDG